MERSVYGSLVAGGLPNPLRLRAQYDLCNVAARRLPLARAVIDAKLAAMQRRLRPVSGTAKLRNRIEILRKAVQRRVSFDKLRGLEGRASRLYYQGWASRIKDRDFAFKTRSRKPPRDAINSLLSFTYSLLFSEMLNALIACGVDPHPGLVHELRPGHPALASDLIEPYRILVADSFVLTLVNTRQVKAEGFVSKGNGGIYMAPETRKDVLVAFEHFMTQPLGGARGSATPRQLLDQATQGYLCVVLGEREDFELPLGGNTSTDSDSDTDAEDNTTPAAEKNP